MSGFTYPAPRKLAELMKLSQMENESRERLTEIWNEYHSTQHSTVSAVWSKQEAETILQRAQSAKFFTFPIRRGEGFYVVLAQFQDKCWLVTYLEDFKQNPASAQPYFTITIYDDLIKTGGDCVFVRGDVCSAMMFKEDGSKLLDLIKQFYLDDAYFKYIETFNHRPASFNYEEVFKLCK
jgi:ATP synthase F1 complex assembly factor 1